MESVGNSSFFIQRYFTMAYLLPTEPTACTGSDPGLLVQKRALNLKGPVITMTESEEIPKMPELTTVSAPPLQHTSSHDAPSKTPTPPSTPSNDPVTPPSPPRSAEEVEARDRAARTLQRVYRGHRVRREMAGLVLSPGEMWDEALEQAEFKMFAATNKKRRGKMREDEGIAEGNVIDTGKGRGRRDSIGKEKWKKGLCFDAFEGNNVY